MVVMFLDCAIFRDSTMFPELPDVLMAIKTSPSLPMAFIWRANMWSNPKSFPAAVSVDVSVVRAMAAIGARSLTYLTVSSVARCCASEALPPLPMNMIFFSFLMAAVQVFKTVEKSCFNVLIVNWAHSR